MNILGAIEVVLKKTFQEYSANVDVDIPPNTFNNKHSCETYKVMTFDVRIT